MTTRKVSNVDRILIAAEDLSRTSDTFTAEDLVVRAWELYPDRFGLQGHLDHPDSNRILTKIMGADSAVRKNGWLSRVGEKRYRLSEVGRLYVAELQARVDGGGSAPQRMASIDRKLVSVLKRMLVSSAVTKYVSGSALSFGDVCAFWNISARSSANQFAEKTAEADKAIELALLHAKDEEKWQLPGDYTAVDRRELEMLRKLSTHIRETFARELDIIRSRRDERRM